MVISGNYKGLKRIEIENLVLEQQQQLAAEFPINNELELKNNI